METDLPGIDPDLFELRLNEFKANAEEYANLPFTSFESHPFTDEEAYNSEIYGMAQEALAFETWVPADIGSGEILAAVIKAIEFPVNNLVSWQSRYEDEARPHQLLYKARKEKQK
jgi:hypothetical protein